MIFVSCFFLNLLVAEAVINGTPDLFYKNNFMVQVLGNVNVIPGFLCLADRYGQGTFLGGRSILTAAHLVNNTDPSSISIKVSSTFQDIGISYEVDRIIIHEDFNILTSPITYAINDIALIITKKEVFETGRIFPSFASTIDGTNAEVIGWGQYTSPGILGSPILRYAEMNVTDFNTCNQLYGNILNVGHLCALSNQGKSPCTGDSGGPLITENLQKAQIGITSFSKECGSTTYPSVFTNVSNYIEWIVANHV